MSNDRIWALAIECATREFNEFDPAVRADIATILPRIMAVKAQMSDVFDDLNGLDICRLCLGECCRTGSYHFTAVDLLGYLTTGRDLFSPGFDKSTCPYLGDNGCIMEPAYRPYNCVTFVCDKIDAGMDSALRSRFAELSSELVELYRKLEALFANRFVYGILNNGARFTEGRSQGIFRS